MSEAQDREGLSDGVSIPRMIKPLLEGFDPARSLLLFYVEFWPVALSERVGRLNCQNLATGSAICARFC
jgi:hypothetical protein